MGLIRRILFIELLGGIGDVLIALPAIHALAKSHPAAHLTVLTFAPGGELLQTDPLIHQVIFAAKGAARSTVDELLSDPGNHFDLIVSDTTYDGIADAIAHSGAHRVVTNLWQSPPPNQRVGDRFLEILLSEGLITPPADRDRAPQLHLTAAERQQTQQQLAATFRPLVILCPDAGMSIKRWPSDRFVAVGKTLQQRYGATILVPVGGDRELADAIVAAIGGNARLWPAGSLRQLAAVLAQADLMIAADTGPARIAAALNVPTLTLFGPSWHDRYGQPDPHRNLQGYPDCPDRQIHNFTEQICWYSGQCPFDWNTCLEDISVDAVLTAAERLLEQQRQPTAAIQPLPAPPVPPFPHPPKNLLVMRLDNIGDVLMTTPVLRTLRENFPQTQITLLASPGGALTAPLLPWVDEVLPWRTLWQDLGKLDFNPDREWELVDTLRQRQFDAAIILTSFSQSPHPPGLVCALAGIPIRIGESKETDLGTLTHAIPPAPDTLHQVDRNLRLLEAIGLPIQTRQLSLHIPPIGGSTFAPPTPPYLLLNPWTTCQSRNYDPDRFALAARQLSDRTGCPVVVTGVAADRDRSRPILETLGEKGIDAIGRTNLSELVALIANAELLLTNNTSTMHIANATQTPQVVLFAGTEYECQWQPRHSPVRLLRRPTVCSPCYAFQCPYQLECLDIAPETVVAAALELLQIPQGSTIAHS